MRVGIMQPYFLPYIGYFQLINYCDVFVIYDDAKYTKKGWISRNRIQKLGVIHNISLEIKRDHDNLSIRDRTLATNFDREKLFRQISGAYAQSPFWDEIDSVLKTIILNGELNLFRYLEFSIRSLTEFLNIPVPILVSSQLADSSLRGVDRVVAICRSLDATEYINPVGGIDLYDPDTFKQNGIEIGFLRTRLSPYAQTTQGFVPGLSIVDTISNMNQSEFRNVLCSDFDIV
jgi:hypothetical protein